MSPKQKYYICLTNSFLSVISICHKQNFVAARVLFQTAPLASQTQRMTENEIICQFYVTSKIPWDGIPQVQLRLFGRNIMLQEYIKNLYV